MSAAFHLLLLLASAPSAKTAGGGYTALPGPATTRLLASLEVPATQEYEDDEKPSKTKKGDSL